MDGKTNLDEKVQSGIGKLTTENLLQKNLCVLEIIACF